MWEQIEKNKRKTIFFILIMSILFIAFITVIGMALFEDPFIGICFGAIVWIIYLLCSYFFGDKAFLNSVRAKKISKEDLPMLYDVVEEMKVAAGLSKMPDIYLIDDPCPNAFATGRTPEKAAIAVTSSLLVKLNRQELQGVIAHEMSHIANRDTLVMLFIGTLLGAIVIIADGLLRSRAGGRIRVRGQAAIFIVIAYLLCLILVPIFAQLIYFAVSRKREYLADACAAQYTRYPLGLANALMKISDCDEPMEAANKVTASMFIVNPLALDKKTMKLKDLTSTHPSTQERIKILSAMANVGFDEYVKAYKKVTHKEKAPIKPNMVLNASKIIAVAPIISTKLPVEETPEVKIKKYRKTEDLLWKYNGYTIIDCECGTKIKIPPERKGQVIKCPHCQKIHHSN